MRTGLAVAGAVMLVAGAVVLFAAIGFAAQAAADLVNCGTLPGFPVPSACADALGRLWMYQAMEGIGGVLGTVGLVLFIVGLVVEAERPAPVAIPYYVPPPYAPPPRPPSPPTPP